MYKQNTYSLNIKYFFRIHLIRCKQLQNLRKTESFRNTF